MDNQNRASFLITKFSPPPRKSPLNILAADFQELADSEFIPASQENGENKSTVDSLADSQLSQSERQDDPEEHKTDTFCEYECNDNTQKNDLQTQNDPQDNYLSESSEHLINNSMTESLRNVSIIIDLT